MARLFYLSCLNGALGWGAGKIRENGSRFQDIMDREAQRLINMPRVPESCSILTDDDYEKFKNFQFLEPESGKRIFMGTTINPTRGNPQEPKNTLGYNPPPGTIVTRSNGYCDRGVYKSWNKCNVDGKCYESCTDGLCHANVKNYEPMIDRTEGCRTWYFKCLEECDSDEKCKAFSFIAQNVLGHPEYTCNLMNSLTCSYKSLNKADERTSFHVKGSYMESLFAKYSASNFEEFDAALERDAEYQFNHWSSWGYHLCTHTPKPGCGQGTLKRRMRLETGKYQIEGRPCEWKDEKGKPIECTGIGQEKKDGHGWMEWSEWSRCSRTCKEGFMSRYRACGSCKNADENGLCAPDQINVSDSKVFFRKGLEHCPDKGAKETKKCHTGACLPPTSGKWKNGPMDKPFKLKTMWALAPKKEDEWTKTSKDWEGGCVDWRSSYKKLNLNPAPLKFHDSDGTFVECMRVCQMEEKDACLAVTFFPSVFGGLPPSSDVPVESSRFYGQDDDGNELYNCFLHNKRCHEEPEFRNAEYIEHQKNENYAVGQDAAKSWYAFKDICNAPKSASSMTCQFLSTYYETLCDSSGDRAFPNKDVCVCPMSGDKGSDLRAWGSTAGKAFYDESTGLIEKTRSFAKPYSIAKFNKIFGKFTLKKYENYMQSQKIGCHNPCQHNRCMASAKCVLNSKAQFGYDCICQSPLEADSSRFGPGLRPVGEAGYGENAGCVIADVRNVAEDYKDNLILFGGGWNQQLPLDGSSVRPKPHYQYYGMEATGSILHYRVIPVPQKIPAPSYDEQKGKFYNCMVNIADNRVMVVGGRPGQSFNIWDDKTFVYEWAKNATTVAEEGKWIGTDGSRLDDTIDGCKGMAGCIRDFDWPDLPSQSVLNCQGQCRNGTAGRGPTDPRWINEYCIVSGEFYIGEYHGKDIRYKLDPMTYSLCQHQLVEDPLGVALPGRDGNWSVAPNENFEEQWESYILALKATIPFYRSKNLVTPDMDSVDEKYLVFKESLNRTVNSQIRWKNPLPSSLYNPIVGPAAYRDILALMKFPGNWKKNLIMMPTIKEYLAPGQPVCGLLGDRVFIGSGKFARLASLSVSAADKEVWKLESNSEFPHLFKRSDGSECLITVEDTGEKDKFPNFRQNFGTVVTTEGLWMIGGLIGPSADLPGRPLNIRYNQPGCTKHSHLDDVWVFSTEGWPLEKILGNDEALIAKYANYTASDILPKRIGYPDSFDSFEAVSLNQSFAEFRLSDVPGGKFELTIDSAIEEGWACTGVSTRWCRKPFIPRPTKGTESLTMCLEKSSGTEERGGKQVPKRPRVCSINETDGSKNEKCICYIVNVAGQSGPKQSEGGSGFRPEVDYLEIPRVDGKWGSDHPDYQDVDEYCPDATATYAGIDPEIVHSEDSAVRDFSKCTTKCGGEDEPACNRSWKSRNLRRKWHEAGRINNGRMGFLSGILKGEIVAFGGECFGSIMQREWNNDGSLRGSQAVNQPHPCGMKVNSQGKGEIDDYVEVFAFLHMNSAGYLFGAPRSVHLDGYGPGKATHDEASVSQAFSAFNTQFNN